MPDHRLEILSVAADLMLRIWREIGPELRDTTAPAAPLTAPYAPPR